MKVIRNVAIGLTVGSILLNIGSTSLASNKGYPSDTGISLGEKGPISSTIPITSLASNEKKDPDCFEDEVLVERNGTYECVPIDDLVGKRQGVDGM